MGYNNVDVVVSGPNKPSSTYKTKVLKGNHSFVSQVTEANTKYVIKYDFDLSGESITIPENCVLEFDGGSLSNGTLTGNNTQIKADKVVIFNSIGIDGTWDVPEITSAWFSDAGDDNISKQLFNLTEDNIYNTIIFEDGTFNVSANVNKDVIFSPKSNTKIILNGDVVLDVNNYSYYFIFDINDVSNVEISGSGKIIGDYSGDIENPGHGSGDIALLGHGFGVRITNASHSIVVKDVFISNCSGDSIYVGGLGHYTDGYEDTPPSTDVTIKNVTMHDSARQCISVTNVLGIEIASCNMYNIDSVSPSAAIDLEPNAGNKVENVVISRNNIHDCRFGIVTNYRESGIEVFNVNIVSNKVVTKTCALSLQEVENVTIQDNYISSNGNFTIRGRSRLNNASIINNEIINLRDTFTEEEKETKSSISALLIVASKVVDISGNNINTIAIPAFIIVGDISVIRGNQVLSPYIFHPMWDVDTSIIEANAFTGYCKFTARKGCYICGNFFNPASDIVINGENLPTTLNLLYITGDLFSFENNTVRVPFQTALVTSTSINYVKNNIFNIDVEGVYQSNTRIIFIRSAKFEDNIVTVTKINESVDPATIILIAATGKGSYIGNTFNNQTELTLSTCMSANSSGVGTLIETCNNFINGNFESIYVSSDSLYNFLFDNIKNRGKSTLRPTLTNNEIGFRFFDTTLGKPIYWNGTAWVDATGATV